MKTQLFQFDYRGKTYCAAIDAQDEAEMLDKLKAMAETARYDGEFIAEIEATDADLEWADYCPDVVN